MSSETESKEQAQRAVVADAVRNLEVELGASGRRKWTRRVVTVLVLAGLGGGGYAYRKATRPPPPARYTTEKIEQRDIVEEVQSTGKVKPLTEVQVGAEVSGRIVDVFVDFNSIVKKGDKLAEIDPSLFGAQVSQTRAQLTAARANHKRALASLETARVNLERLEKLSHDGIATLAEVDQARGSFDVAEAEVAAAKAQIDQLQAQLASASTTLKHTRIYSPIDGVVINRAVDPGQTVAASFSAPVLFVIAQDLSKMQVLADIDEADVGKLKEGMEAKVVVDAFLGKEFDGRVSQIRYSPNDVQGVVTYSAVIDVDNSELKLRPGMTATVSIETRAVRGATAVPNAALRFRPLGPATEPGEGPATPSPAEPAQRELEFGEGRLYLLTSDTPGAEEVEARIVHTGITDGRWTALDGDAPPPGTVVVTEQRDAQATRKFLGLF